MMYVEEFKAKSGKDILIVEVNLPDDKVKGFLDSFDDFGKRKFRHVPEEENEIQYFAFEQKEDNILVLAGYGALYPKDSTGPVDLAVAVHQDYRGEGLGGRMYELSEVIAKLNDKTKITGETDADNDAALHMLKKLGFDLYGPIYQCFKDVE